MGEQDFSFENGAFSERTTGSLLEVQNATLDAEVKASLDAKRAQISAEILPSVNDYALSGLSEEVDRRLTNIGLVGHGIRLVQVPRGKGTADSADVGLNIAKSAFKLGLDPKTTAAEGAIATTGIPGIRKAEATGPYINFELDFGVLAPKILDQVLSLGDEYGKYREGEPEIVVIDYSSPNIAKNMTVAHLRSTIIGHSLMKIQEAVGNIPFAVNHVGDWGTQFGNIIYQYRKEMESDPVAFQAELDNDPTAALMRIYRKFTKEKDSDPKSVDEAREIFLHLEQGDPELVTLWSQFREWSLRDFGPTYDRLRIDFDAIQGESFYEDRMPGVIDDALKKGVLVRNNEGSVVFPSQPLIDPISGEVNSQIMFDQSGEPRDEVIVKPSGGTVYLTRDIAAIYYRAKELGADRILYVIGKEQQAHCLELFNMAHQLGYMALGNAVHVSFGHLNVDGRKMKSREGKVVLLNELLDESEAAASAYIAERDAVDIADLSEAENRIASQIGIGALVFGDLRQDRTKDIEFSADMARAVEAGGVAYVQYTNARLGSVLSKFEKPGQLVDLPELSVTERDVLVDIARFPEIIQEAAKFNAPHKIASYLTKFCQRMNAFYSESPVMQAESETHRNFRLHLIASAIQVISNSANLLHVELPERM